MACVGKRSLGYAIAKRMAALNSLDLKDSDGMVEYIYIINHCVITVMNDYLNALTFLQNSFFLWLISVQIQVLS